LLASIVSGTEYIPDLTEANYAVDTTDDWYVFPYDSLTETEAAAASWGYQSPGPFSFS